jgi:hypothetical protein
VTPESTLNTQNLLKDFGNCLVPISQCSYQSYQTTCQEMYLTDYFDYLTVSEMNSPKLYLKDFHFMKQFKGIEKPFNLFEVFADDILNEYYESLGADDFKFLYLGPKGSFTPLHTDVLQSYSWSANILGRKQWYFVSPQQKDKLKNIYGEELTNLFSRESFPKAQDLDILECIQEPGEIVFVPR